MRESLSETRAAIGHGCWHIGDLVWRLLVHSVRYDLSQYVRLWEDGTGNLAGFAVFNPPRAFDFQVCPDWRGCGLEEEMLKWVEQFGSTDGLRTDTGVYADDASQIAVLERSGFTRGSHDEVLLLRLLDEPIPGPHLPEGFTARCVAGEHEIENRAAAHREAFHPSRVTNEVYRSLMRTEGYSTDLDMVAVAPDGTIAAFALGWIDPINQVGEFEPVGTRPAFRRTGLARAALLEGLKRMQAHGAHSAVIGPIGLPDARQLYESIGFRVINTTLDYRRNT